MHTKDGAQRQQLVCPFELKDLTDKGTFTGYGSIFNNVDLGGDVIVGPEPFKKFKKTKDGHIRLLAHHDTHAPVGKTHVEQDEKGLWMPDAHLIMDMPSAPATYAGMKSGLLDGLSVGFDVLPKGSAYNEETRVRELSKLELWEISIVTFGMNPLAKIQSVKAAQNIKTVREYEEFLRHHGFTAQQAKAIAAVGWKEGAQPRDVGAEAAKSAAARISAFDFGDQRDAAPVGIKGLLRAVEQLNFQ